MIKITRAQMDALEVACVENMVRRISAFVGAHCDFTRPYDGSQTLELAERPGAIRELVGRAKGYGISTERGFVQFTILGLGYSRCFDQTPRVQQMLSDPQYLPDENVQRVLNAVVVAEARRA